MIIELKWQGKDILLVGDFNIHNFQPDTDTKAVANDARLNELLCIISAAGLHSYNNILNYQSKTLDLVLSTLNTVMVTEGISLTERPDKYHPPLEITI